MMGVIEQLNREIKIYISLLIIFAMGLGIAGNLATIIVVGIYRKLHLQKIYILISNLALCGLIMDIFVIPLFGISILKDWPQWHFGKNMCSAVIFAENVCISTFVLTFLLISVTQYVKITRKQTYSHTVICVWLLSTWIVSICAHAIHSFKYQLQINHNTTVCSGLYGITVDETSIYITGTRIIIIIIVLILVALTGRLLKRMKNNNISKSTKTAWSDFKLTVLTVCICLICWLASWVLYIAQSSKVRVKTKLYVISMAISHLCTIITPVISIMFSKQIRRSLKDLLTGGKESIIRNKHIDHRDSLKLLTARKTSNTEYSKPKFTKSSYTIGKTVEIGDKDLCEAFLETQDAAFYGKRNHSFDGDDDLDNLVNSAF